MNAFASNTFRRHTIVASGSGRERRKKEIPLTNSEVSFEYKATEIVREGQRHRYTLD